MDIVGVNKILIFINGREKRGKWTKIWFNKN